MKQTQPHSHLLCGIFSSFLIIFCNDFPVTPASSQKVGVYIQGPALEQLQNKRQLTVTCLFAGTSLSDFSITWKVGANKASTHNIHTQQPVGHSNGTETLQSSFNISVDDWNSYKTVICKAKHRCSNRVYDGNVSKSRGIIRLIFLFCDWNSELLLYFWVYVCLQSCTHQPSW